MRPADGPRRLPGVQASRGCTEPAAIALAAALATRALGPRAERVSVRCDRATLKNAQAARIPGAGGARGAELAAALGVSSGDPERGLEALEAVRAEQVEGAERLVVAGAVTVEEFVQEGPPSLWIEARVEGGGHVGRALLAGSHTTLVALELDGVPVAERPGWAEEGVRSDPDWEGWELEGVLALADALEADDLEWYYGALELNLLASGGARSTAAGSVADRAEAVAAAASRARMEGEPVTVVTSGFSGNQGLTASIPVWAVGEARRASRSELARALATSHYVGSYVRGYTGLLSSFCNAVHAASAGAAAGCVRLLGGDAGQAELACRLVLATATGVLCDGGKPACSLKVGLGAHQAVRAAERAVAGGAVSVTDGLGAEDFRGMLENLRRLAEQVMPQVDHQVLAIVRGACP